MHAADGSVSLVPVTPDDQQFLYDLYCSTRSEELDAVGFDPQQREMFFKLQYNSQRQVYAYQFSEKRHSIIRAGDRRVGRIWVFDDKDQVRLIDISLLPEARSRGIGTELIEQLKTEAADTGKTLRLQVAIGNRAIELYRRLGFLEIGQSGSHYQMEWRPDA